MSYTERIELYRKIEEHRGRPLIAYVTSSRQGAAGQMGGDVVPELAKQLLAIPRTEENIDILVVSQGGDPMVAAHVISMLRERFKTVAVLLPFTAFSAATLLALGANEIVMHPLSNLGPVDPQLRAARPVPGDESKQAILNFGAEDLANFLSFAREDVGISDQEQLQRAFELICKDVGALPVGIAKRSSKLSVAMGEKLLSLHMQDINEARAIAESLSKSFFHHGYPIGRTDAEKIGLPVTRPEQELEDWLWQVWQDVEEDMQCNDPFSPLAIVFDDPDTAALLAPVIQVQLAANLPPQIASQAYKGMLSQVQLVAVKPVDFELFQATMESIRCRSEYRSKGKVNAVRMPDMNIKIGVTTISKKWTSVENPDIILSESKGKLTEPEGENI